MQLLEKMNQYLSNKLNEVYTCDDCGRQIEPLKVYLLFGAKIDSQANEKILENALTSFLYDCEKYRRYISDYFKFDCSIEKIEDPEEWIVDENPELQTDFDKDYYIEVEFNCCLYTSCELNDFASEIADIIKTKLDASFIVVADIRASYLDEYDLLPDDPPEKDPYDY